MKANIMISPVVNPELERLIERARELIESSSAASTRKAYASDFRDFSQWCRVHSLVALPATKQTVALYCAQLILRLRYSTIARRLSAIAHAHKSAGFKENPASTVHHLIGATVKGMHRTLGTAQTGREALTTDAVLRILAGCPGNLLGLRNRALFLLIYAGGFRREEAAGIDMASLSFSSEGVTVFLPRSKTDPYGSGRYVGIPYGAHAERCPVRALAAWLRAAGIVEGPVFRAVDRHGRMSRQGLRSDAIGRILKKAARRAGLDASRIGAHSLRAGHVTQCALAGNGLDEAAVMSQTGHTSVEMSAAIEELRTCSPTIPQRASVFRSDGS